MALIVAPGLTPPATTQLSTPTLTVTPNTAGTENVCSWPAVANATQYRLQKSLDLGVSYGVLPGTEWVITGTSQADSGISPLTNRYYRVRAESSDPAYTESEYDIEGPVYTDPSVPSDPTTGPPAPSTYSYFVPGQANSRSATVTGGQQAGGYDFVITSLADTSTYSANYAGKGSTWYSGTWRGARDFSYTLPAGTPLRVKRAISGKCATTGFFSWSKSNLTIDLISGPSPGFFFEGMTPGWAGGSNILVAGLDVSMDNNTSPLDNRDAMYIGNIGLAVFFGCTWRWSCDECVDGVEKTSSQPVGIYRSRFSEPLSNAGRGETHGYWFIAAYNGIHFDLIENVFDNGNARAPLFRSTGCNFLNNVVINCGYQNSDAVKFAGWGEFGGGPEQGGTPVQNIAGNKYVSGPNPATGSKPINIISNLGDFATIGSSARFCVRENYHKDPLGIWGSLDPTSPTTYISEQGTAIPGGVITTTVQSSIYPTGKPIWTLSTVGSAVDETEFDNCITWMLDHTGYRPGDRSAGRDATVVTRLKNWMSQNGGTYPEIIDDESEAGGHFTVPTNTTDIFSGADPTPTTDAETLQLCTDGLYRMKRDIHMLRQWANAGHQSWGVAA